MRSTSLNEAICEDGGLLIELFKDEKFGQLTLRHVPVGETAGRHRHPLTNEWWVVAKGEAVVRLEFPDGMRELHNISGSRPKVLKVPAGTGHEIKNVGEEEVILLYHADRIYDPEQPDKEDWEWT